MSFLESDLSEDNNMKKPLNLETIAEKSGVSRSTVSRVINNHPNVSARARARVMAVIEQEGYSPNPAARMLVTQRTQVIGVVIPFLPAVLLNDAYHFRLLQGIAKITAQHGYAMLLWLQDENMPQERFYENIRRNRLTDGLFISPAMRDSYIINQLVQDNIPFVTVERHDWPTEIGYVTIDNVAAARLTVEHLLKSGRRRIGIVSGPLTNVDAFDRLEGYKQALHESGIGVDDRLIYTGDFSRGSGHSGAKHLLLNSVDAIFATNDYVALGALDALNEAAVHVPQQIALVGFDDLEFAARTVPKLTTTAQPIQEKAEMATRLLLDYIEGSSEGPQRIILPTKLIVRESCGAQNNAGKVFEGGERSVQ